MPPAPPPPEPPEPLRHTPAWHAPMEHGVPFAAAGFEHTPVSGAHVPATWHSSLGMHTTFVPAVQTAEPLHVSAPLQRFESAHDVPEATGVCETPPVGEHASAVQGLLSSVGSGVPGWHEPPPQISLPLQRFASRQGWVLFAWVQTPVPGVHPSVVHTLLSLQLTGVPG
jgi:hypothetical protein